MSLPEPWQLETAAGPAALDEVQLLLTQAWSASPHVPSRVRTQMAVVTAEIVANIIEHAGTGRQVRIAMEVSVLATEVRVKFTDDGAPMELDLSSVKLPDSDAERGRGLALAQAALERLTYQRTTANHWTLVSKPFGDAL